VAAIAPCGARKEKVMTTWRKSSANEVYTLDEVTQRLQAELPAWYVEDGWIRRKYRTSGWKATLMVVNTVGHLAEAAWHHPDLNVSYAFVIVKLMNHSAKGITDKDFALASKIEEVLTWRPGAEPDAALEGTPDDPRFKYLKYD
jgi:4a-hydroxytetrahydrobiopterin dehydratase